MSIAIDGFNIPRPVPTAPTPVLDRTQTNLLANLIIVVPATDWAMFAWGAVPVPVALALALLPLPLPHFATCLNTRSP